MKVCSKCKVAQELSMFNKESACEDGLTNRCKTCKAKHKAEYKKSPRGFSANLYANQKVDSTHRGNGNYEQLIALL